MSDFLSAFLSYGADKAQAKAAKRMQEYRNGMVNIANAINQNAITQNTTLAIQQSAKQAVHMRRDELSTLGSTAVASAAAGVRGRSVTSTLLNVQRQAGLMEKQRSDDLQQYFLQAQQQRLSSSLSAVQSQDLTAIPEPSLGAYLFDAAKSTVSSLAGGSLGVSSGSLGNQTIDMSDYLSGGARTDISYANSGGYGPYRF